MIYDTYIGFEMTPIRMHRINLDHNATTPLLPAVLDKMLPVLRENSGNPSSAHSLGVDARAAVETARTQVATLVGAEPASVLFTSSATEAINTVIASCTQASSITGRIVVTGVEHASVLQSAAAAKSRGYETLCVGVDRAGRLNLESLEQAISPATTLVCVMWANNESGVVFPISEIAALCATRGVPLLVDAVQAAGKLPITMADLGIDFLAINAHKIYGPKGIGALVVANPLSVRPLLFGGHQEGGRRAGTENVPGIIGFGEAARLARQDLQRRTQLATPLRDQIESEILRRVPFASVNGADAPRIYNTSNIGFDGIDADTLVAELDSLGVCVSTGSACHSDSISPSHVVMAMTGSYEKASEAVRFSVSHLNTKHEIDHAIEAVVRTVEMLRAKAIPA